MSWFRSSWSLHNPLKGWTLTGLSDHELRLIHATLSLPERRVSWLWKKKWPQWRRLEEVFSSNEQVKSPAMDPTAPALPRGDSGHDEVTPVHIVKKAARTWGREHDRHPIAIDAEIIMGHQTCRLRTENISVGGIKFIEKLPDWLAGYFTVILYRPEGAFELTAALVEDQKNDKTRIELVETEDEESHLPKYRDWVLGELNRR